MRTLESSSYSLKLLLKADSISKKVEITRSRYLDLQNSLGELYSGEHNYDFSKSKFYRLRNLKLGYQFKDSFIIARACNNLADLYNKERKDSALYYINLGFKFENFSEARARLHDNLADYQVRKGKLLDALKSIHTSLEIMTKSEINTVPTDFQISESLLLDYTLFCLKKKTEIYLRLYKQDSDMNYLKKALNNIERADYVAGLLLNATTEESTQIIWRREASQAYLYGAYAAHLLGDSEKAFYFMEKNKALLLSEGVLKNTEFANLPKHISDEEIRRKKQIYQLESLLSKEEGNTILQDSLFNTKRSYELYVDSLKVEYPKYYAR